MNEPGPVPYERLDFSKDYRYVEDFDESASGAHYAVLQFQKPVTCTQDALIIASKLDADVSSNTVGGFGGD